MNESTYLRLSNQKEAPVGWELAFMKDELDEILNSIIKGIKEQNKNFSPEKIKESFKTLTNLLSMIKMKEAFKSAYHFQLTYKNTDKDFDNEKVYAILGPVTHFSVNRVKSNFNIPVETIKENWKNMEQIQKAIREIVKVHRDLYRTQKNKYMTNYHYHYGTLEANHGEALDNALKKINEICSLKKKIEKGLCEIISVDPLSDIISSDAYNVYIVDKKGNEGYIDFQFNLTSLSKAKMFKSEKEAEQAIKQRTKYYNSIYIVKHKIKLDKVVKQYKSSKMSEDNLTRSLNIKQKNELSESIEKEKNNKQIKPKKKIM